jgi:conjugal transfer pilus assembly protein TraW
MQDMRESYSKQVSPEGETATNALDFDVQIFISSGMPEGVLRSLFRQALDEGAKRVRFVVRGFEPQKVGELLKKLRMLLPDPYKDDVLVEVDPNAFRAYNVTEVPVYLVKNKDKWYSVKGTVSIDGARERARKGGNYKAGELYAIAEPDILSVIEERSKKYDWEGAFARARSRAAQNLKPNFDLPTVVQDSTDYFVPTFTVPEDVTGPGPDGKGTVVLAKEGQTFRLLDHTKLQVPVIAVDATDERQVRLVQSWLRRPEYKAADVFIVGSTIQSPGGGVAMEELVRKFNRPVFPLFKRLGERFGIQAVPAIVEQDGDRLRIRYFNPQTKG